MNVIFGQLLVGIPTQISCKLGGFRQQIRQARVIKIKDVKPSNLRQKYDDTLLEPFGWQRFKKPSSFALGGFRVLACHGGTGWLTSAPS